MSFALIAAANAASFGHSRLLSANGQPLRIQVPVRQLTQQDIQVLNVTAAPVALWQQAGLTPPVELSSMQFSLAPGVDETSRVVQISSSQSFSAPVADLLLEVRTARGKQQYQVSILATDSAGSPTPPQVQPGPGLTNDFSATRRSASIDVRRGDTLWAIALANDVQGVSIYQLMVGLHHANEHAFIRDNLNLLRAGTQLTMPDIATLSAISDTEARRIFRDHAHAFAAYRQNIAALPLAAALPPETAKGQLAAAAPPRPVTEPPSTAKDLVVLSSGPASPEAVADDRLATSKNIKEADERISQLEQNVKSLNQALQSQGEAAKEAVFDGALSISQSIADITGAPAQPSPDDKATRDSTQLSDDRADGTSTQPADSTGTDTGTQRTDDAVTGPSATAQERNAQAEVKAGSRADVASTKGTANTEAGPAITLTSPTGAALASASSGTDPIGSASSGRSPTSTTPESTSNRADKPVSWIQQNMLGVITAILAFIVLVVAWVLRRANSGTTAPGQQPITEAMVKEQLEKINLDLEQDPSHNPSSRT